VTRADAAARTFEVHREAFRANDLGSAWQRVIAMVVQPGVDFDHSRIHHYDAEAAASLSAFVCGRPGLVFEAHSTDYQTEASLHQLVRDHFAILKVGPAATYAYREGLFALAAIECELLPARKRSLLLETLDRAMLEEPRHWQKHYMGTEDELRLMRKYALSDRCRYYWGQPRVQRAVERLMANLAQMPLPLTLLSQFMPEQHGQVVLGRLASRPEVLIQHKIFGLLAQYARACARNVHENTGL
jgi:D-tagatose-1,6-bisphosphate aldolase subunit GatZ/KbaZ